MDEPGPRPSQARMTHMRHPFSFQALTSLYRVSHSAWGYEAVAESHAGRMMPISLDKGALRSCRLSFTEPALLAGSRQKRQPARRGAAGDRAS
jgi:hypothetical protein